MAKESGQTFQSKEEFYEIMRPFCENLIRDPLLGSKFRDAKLTIRFIYSHPEGSVTADFAGPPPADGTYGAYSFDDTSLAPAVTMRQSADFSNRFWCGKANLVSAMATRQVVASGSVQKALALVPLLRPAFELYKKTLRDLGREDLIIP